MALLDKLVSIKNFPPIIIINKTNIINKTFLNNFNFNSHGESKVKLSAFLEYVNAENVNSIADNEVLLTIMFVSEVEVEDEEE